MGSHQILKVGHGVWCQALWHEWNQVGRAGIEARRDTRGERQSGDSEIQGTYVVLLRSVLPCLGSTAVVAAVSRGTAHGVARATDSSTAV